jgi:drug/metabolite transporter (DMT)-like permease
MSLAACSFAVMSALVRYLSQEISPLEIAFFRNLFGLAFLMPMLIQAGWANLRTNNFKRYSLRAVLGLISMYSWFVGLAYLPLADATTLSFIAPIIASIFAVVFLGERAGWRRWSAITVAFGGALLILRPGFQEISPAALLLLLASGQAAWRILLAAAGLLLLAGLAQGNAEPWAPLLQGSIVLTLLYLAADPVSSAATNPGRWIYGLLVGGLAVLFATVGPAFGAAVFAVLLGSIFAPLLDRIVIAVLAIWRERRHG